MNLTSFFHPKSIAVVGVSETAEKVGTITFQNIIESGYKGKLFAVNPSHGGEKLYGHDCFEKVSDIPGSLDLVVIVIPAKFVSGVIDDSVQNKSKNVVVISAGFSEVGNTDQEKEIAEKCRKAGINLLGPNCLGVIFPYANLNASFADGFPDKGNIAFLSQSGAFCTAILDWAQQKGIGFSHFISLGNKADLSEVELLAALAKDSKAEIIALYLESLRDGRKLLDQIRQVVGNKPIVILEPGKSEKASESALSHTGSMAPNYRVLQSAFRNSGAVQVQSMREMFGILELLSFAPKKRHGNKVAVLTNAGGVGVITTDLIDGSGLELVELAPETISKLKKVLPDEAALHNPVDIIGDARADRYEVALKILLEVPEIDQILVLLTPQRTTEISETAAVIQKYFHKTDKCLIASFVGGKRTAEGEKILEAAKIPVFDFPSDAVQVMGLLAKRKREVKSGKCRGNPLWLPREESKGGNQETEGLKICDDAGKQCLASSCLLSAEKMKTIIEVYEFDVPKSDVFESESVADKFAKQFFPKSVVMKITSPGAIHKTEMKGVFLNINSSGKFQHAWDSLEKSIRFYELKQARIQVQEQIDGGVQVIVGVKTDPTFGKVLLFGTGGIYTEIFADNAVRIVPVGDLDNFINETKIARILRGARGKEMDINGLKEVLEKVQRLVLDFPEIDAVDINPVIVTEERAVCVDFKLLL